MSCIWYCITGDRFQQVEIDLLNALRTSYGDNTIPIIVIYTQAVDEKIIADMEKYIKEKKINATFIKVLAERKKLVNQTYLEQYGLDDLLKETLKKCKQAMQGDMRSVMANNISNYIKDTLIKENSYIRQYINEISVSNFIGSIYNILNDENFEKYIIDIYQNNIKYFFEKKEIKNKESFNAFKNSMINENHYQDYKNFYFNEVQNILENDIRNLSIELIDLQAKMEKKNNNNLFSQNKRDLNDFEQTTLDFLQDNFYCAAQKYYISFILRKAANNLSSTFESHLNDLIRNLINSNDIKKIISECFLNKFNDYEKKIKNFVPTFNNNNGSNYNENNNFNNNFITQKEENYFTINRSNEIEYPKKEETENKTDLGEPNGELEYPNFESNNKKLKKMSRDKIRELRDLESNY